MTNILDLIRMFFLSPSRDITRGVRKGKEAPEFAETARLLEFEHLVLTSW